MTRTHRLVTVLLLSAAPAGAWPATRHPPPPADAKVSRALLDLRAAMMNSGRDKALADIARFRPLCDQDGYPLVGNLVGKTVYQPSEFCSDVRKREKRS